MGRTRLTYRDRVQHEREQWREMERLLRRRWEADYEHLWEHVANHSAHVGAANPVDVWKGIWMAICLQQEHLLRQQRIRIERLEDELGLDGEVTAGDLVEND